VASNGLREEELMAKAASKITLSPSRNVPFDKLVRSQSKVRRIKAGVSVDKPTEPIARRGILQSPNVRS
jgi:ParB family chromosome partitioning protein